MLPSLILPQVNKVLSVKCLPVLDYHVSVSGVGETVLFTVMSRPSGDYPLSVEYWSLKLIIHVSAVLRQICFFVLYFLSPCMP